MAVSEAFIKAFDSGGGGCIRTCRCGRTHFNDVDEGFYDDREELEDLRKKALEDPDKFIPVDGDVGTTTCLGISVVYNCPCKLMERQEERLIACAYPLLQFFKEYSKKQKEEADALAALAGEIGEVE